MVTVLRRRGRLLILALGVVLGVSPVRADGREDLIFIMESRGFLPAGGSFAGGEAGDKAGYGAGGENSVKDGGRGGKTDRFGSIPETASELELAAYLLLRLYQLLISTQDASSCMFVPTCSRYAMAAVEKHGIVRGVIMASDRLQRCNGWGRDLYPLDPETAKLLDSP